MATKARIHLVLVQVECVLLPTGMENVSVGLSLKKLGALPHQ